MLRGGGGGSISSLYTFNFTHVVIKIIPSPLWVLKFSHTKSNMGSHAKNVKETLQESEKLTKARLLAPPRPLLRA